VSAQPFDPTRFKAAQRADWSDAAVGWRRWWKTIEDGLGPVSDRLVDLAQLKSGDKVLDIATGIGEPAVTAARRVGRAGHVVAIDIAPGAIEIGRERASELQLDNIEFREADAEQVELPHESFDSVLSRFGLMLFPNLDAVLHRIRHTLIKGGRLAAAVWGQPERSPFTALPAQTLMRQLNLPPPAPGTPGPFSLADTDALERRLRDTGFAGAHTERMTVTMKFASAAEYTEFVRAVGTTAKNLLRDKPEKQQQEAWSAITRAAQSHASADGSITLPAEVSCVLAWR
jgi:enediyne biosynthesis protein CalE5